jgi:hypothetical protein
MALGSLPASAITLLDVLVTDYADRRAMAWRVRESIDMPQKTARRNWCRLRSFGLVQWDNRRKLEQRVTATPLGVALIAARYQADR